MDEFETADSPDAAVEAEFPSLPSRLFDVFVSPAKVMEAVAGNPAWVGALLVAAVLVAVQTALIPVDIIMAAQRDAALEAGRDAPEMPETIMNVMRYVMPLFGLIGALFMTFLFSGIYALIFAFALGDEGRYRQYLAITAHAWFVPAVIGLALVPLKIATQDAQATLNLGSFMFFLPDGYWASVFGLMDLTQLWAALIIAQGAHAIDSRRSFGSAAAILIGISFVFALVIGLFV